MRAVILVVLLLSSCANSRERACITIANEGWKLYEDGDPGRAKEVLQKGLKEHPEGACSWRLRAILTDTLMLRRELKPALEVAGNEDPPANVDIETRFRFDMAKGYVLGLNGKVEEGLKLVDRARAIAEREKKPIWQVEALLRWANLQGLSDPKKAEPLLREAVALATDSGAQRLAVDASLALSFTLIRQERVIEAERILDAALKTARSLTLPASEARILTNLAPIYMRWGEHLRALETLVEVERIAKQRGMLQERVAALQNLGNVQYLLRNGKAAASYLDQALELARELKADRAEAAILYNRSRVALDAQDYTLAAKLIDEYYARRKASKDPEAELSYQLRLAQLLRGRGDLDQAARKLNALAKQRINPSMQWTIENELASIAELASRYAEADKHHRASLDIMMSQRKTLQSPAAQVSFTSGNVGLHHQYVRFLIERGDALRALEIADWSRSTSAKAPMTRFTVQSLKDLAKRRQATLLVYWIAPRQSLLWVITPQRFEVVPLGTEDEIRELVARASARELFQKLVAPALRENERGGNVIVIPDGQLQQLNPESFDTGTGHWIQSATLVRANSVASLLGAPQRAEGRTMLAIGDADSPSKDFPKLSGAGAEISEVEVQFEGRVKSHRGAMATPDAYLASKPEGYDYIHFATHAIADLRAPMDSALILSPSPAGYRLRASDIAACPIKAQLVTLASCRSAGARVSSGGLLGMAWAFLQAGAGAVIASLHDVDDRAAKQLSRDLYAGINSGLTPERALREAKLKMLRGGEFASPDHWAAWIMILGK